MAKGADNKMNLQLPLNVRWLQLTENIVRQYAHNVGFTEILEEMFASSVQEACGELITKAKDAGIEGNYNLVIDTSAEAVELSISYDSKIPLNPLKNQPYEVPSDNKNVTDINLDMLWLFIIKRRMDRVFFVVKGNRHTLKMMKYKRKEGKELQVWVMGLSPCLKKGLNIDLLKTDGTVKGGVVQDFDSSEVLQLGASEIYAVQQMDGKKSLYEIYLSSIENEYTSTPYQYTKLYEALESHKMLETKENRQQSRLKRIQHRMSHLTFSIPQPDKTITKIYRNVRLLFSPAGTALCMLIGLSCVFPLIRTYDKVFDIFNNFGRELLNNIWIIPAFYLISTLFTMVHEFAHGLTCKHYGGRIPRLGITFYISSFIFFCDTTSSLNFPKKISRIMVSLAGPVSSFMLLGVSSWAFYFSSSPAWNIIWGANIISLLFGLAMNFNPFVRMDSYYVLMDITGIANLRKRSFEYLWCKIKHLFGGKAPAKENPHTARILISYGIIGNVMTFALFFMPFAIYLPRMFSGNSLSVRLIWGCVILLITGYTTLSKLLPKLKTRKEYTLS